MIFRRARWVFCSAAVAGALFFLATAMRAQQNPKALGQSSSSAANAPDSAQSAPASDYVGSETCKACHEDIYDSWEKTPHWKTTLDTKGGPSRQGCESCHGPGAAHVAGGGDVTKI